METGQHTNASSSFKDTLSTDATEVGAGPRPSTQSWRRPVVRRHRTAASMEMTDYFEGPRDADKHSKWPFFMRMHGSVLPKMILPLFFISAWSTLITCLCRFVYDLSVDSVLLTVLGFVVGLGLSFRSSTAYERYSDGRKFWTQLISTSHVMARTIWVGVKEREGELGRKDLIGKLTALNLISGFALAVKHKLRFEPGATHDDLMPYINFVDSFALAANDSIAQPNKKNVAKKTGEYLGISFAESNPRKLVKKSNEKRPIGNLPLEILKYLSAYTDSVIVSQTLTVGMYQTHILNGISSLNDCMAGCERVLNTPLPIAYSIAISQITWVYVLMLPFQLWKDLNWVTIPGCIFAAYIILGLSAIGREIENPFGSDVNDLPLEAFCDELINDINIMTASPSPDVEDFLTCAENLVLHPQSKKGADVWATRGKNQIREALARKADANLRHRQSIHRIREEVDEEKHERPAESMV